MFVLPRYKLALGRRLTYRSSVPTDIDSKHTGALSQGVNSTEWQCFVMNQDSEGLARIAFSQSTGQVATDDNSTVSTSGLQAEGHCDVDAYGRVTENGTITPLANLTVLFPELPAVEDLAVNGWSSELQLDRTQRSFTGLITNELNGATSVRFDESCVTNVDAAYLASRRRRYRFDPVRGIVVQVETEFQRNWPSLEEPTREVIQLVDDAVLGADELRELSTSSRVYFSAQDRYQRLIDMALWDVAECAPRLQEARLVLEEAAPAVSHPTIQRWLARKLAIHKQEHENLVADSQRTASAIDRRVPDWQAVDLDGQHRGSREFLGHVTILCFWNRGCSWAIRVLVALNSLAIMIGERPIKFLGMCAERDEQSARFVAQAVKLGFPTVVDGAESMNLAAAFGVEGWPSVVVIDRDGFVRRIRAGYWRAMPSMLMAEVKRLESGMHCIGC